MVDPIATFEEYGVVQLFKGGEKRMMPSIKDSFDEAKGYAAWLEQRDREIAEKAASEKAVMDRGSMPESNHNYMLWNRGVRSIGSHPPLKDVERYYIVWRRVSEWQRVS